MRRMPADPRRLDDQRHGRIAEALACAVMMLRGYRIQARRERTPYGEIDIIAVRGRRVAFIEVKYRPTIEAGYAALEGAQSRRIADAAEHWISRRRAFGACDLGFDAVIVVPWRWPIYLQDAMQPIGTDVRADR